MRRPARSSTLKTFFPWIHPPTLNFYAHLKSHTPPVGSLPMDHSLIRRIVVLLPFRINFFIKSGRNTGTPVLLPGRTDLPCRVTRLRLLPGAEDASLDRLSGGLDLRRDERLHLGDVLFVQVVEPLLVLHVLLDRLVRLRNVLVGVFALLPFVVRPHSGLDGLLGDLDGVLAVEEPALRARAVDVDEGRTLVVEALADLVDQVDRVADRRGCDVVHGAMPADDQPRRILG